MIWEHLHERRQIVPFLRQHSGRSGVEYCREHGLHVRSFYRWKRRIRALDAGGHESAHGGAPGRVASCGNGTGVRFAEVMVARAVALEVVLAGGRRIQVYPGSDEATLARIVAVLEGASER